MPYTRPPLPAADDAKRRAEGTRYKAKLDGRAFYFLIL